MKLHPYLRIALAAAVILAVVLVVWLDLSRSTRSLMMLAVLVVGGLVYLVLRLAGVVEKPRPPARGRFENGRFIDETPDVPASASSAGVAALLVEAILDVADLSRGRARKRDKR